MILEKYNKVFICYKDTNLFLLYYLYLCYMKITIFWLAGSGTSTIWKLLSEKTNFTFMSTWNIMRSWSEDMWYSIYQFEDKVVKNDSSFDLKLDEKVKLFWEENDNFIFESRLAWYFIPDSFKIYLDCGVDERYRRIQNREWLLLDEVIEKNEKRERELEIRYNKVYPNITFPPLKTSFDLVIDGSNTPDEIVEEIMKNIN